MTLRLVGKVKPRQGRVVVLPDGFFFSPKACILPEETLSSVQSTMRAVIEQQWSIVTMMGKRLR